MKRLMTLGAIACLFVGGCEEMQPPSWTHQYDTPGCCGDQQDGSRQDVIPIDGDSSGPVDEIMDGGVGLHLMGLHTWAFSAPEHPVALYTKRDDGDLDIRVLSRDGISPDDFRLRLSAPTVLVPLLASSRPALERALERDAPRGSGVHVTRARLHAYCVEAAKAPSSAGTFFVRADPETARRFDAVQGLARVADRAASDGILRPQGDPRAYGRFIAQYAVWTKLEGWDAAGFTKAFVERTRLALTAANKPWSPETEQTLRALAPARWRDIQIVITNTTHTPRGGLQ